MLPMKNTLTSSIVPFKRFCGLMQRFRDDEEGGIIIMTLLLLVTMLVVGGMAVDFMRFESERVELQSVADRAVLAAADLQQTLDAKEVAIDFYRTSGFEHTLNGDPEVIDSGNSRVVTVNSAIDVNTFYLRLVGIDQLQAPARSRAVEGVGKVEISMVLDISGSMREGGSTYAGRFYDMQQAAKRFAEIVLDPANNGQVSLNIVPYAGATNPGPVMFDFLKARRYDEPTGGGVDTDSSDDSGNGAVDATGGSSYPNVSSCIEFAASDWTTSGLPGEGRNQVPHFMNWTIAASVMDWGWCPQDRSAIRYALRDANEAKAFIDGIRMHDGTGTHYAMKWGLAALDPASQPAFEELNRHTYTNAAGVVLPQVPDAFKDRPAPWGDPETRKIIILMTDGRITEQVRPVDAMHELNPTKELNNRPSGHRMNITTAAQNVTSFEAICNLAKDPLRDVEVFTIAFEVTGTGATQMRNCASDVSMYSATAGANLTTVFENIARQITDLRLSL